MDDLTCAGCGKTMRRVVKSQSQGLARCQPCRRQERNDLTCADCDKRMFRSASSLPQGEARCLACRRIRREASAGICTICGERANGGAALHQRCRPGVKCGTYSGWARHKAMGEDSCESCSEAMRAYHAEYRSSGRKKREGPSLKTCAACGEQYSTTWHRGRYCSQLCYRYDRHGPLSCPVRRSADEMQAMWRSQRGELRAGYEDGDADLFFAALVTKADTRTECWIWPQCRDGYPHVRFGRRDLPLHRLVLEMKHGAALGSQHAHHACANTACVNPDHLQPVTHRENAAEMLARRSYLARIRELEEALSLVVPDHPLLTVIAVA